MAAMILLAWGADGAVPVKKTPAKKTAPVSRSTPAKKRPSTASTSKTSASRRTAGKKAPVSRVTWRNRQMAPTSDRYKEIQGALAAKGYLRPEDVTGAWNPASSDALKKFQTEQNLESTGKINSLSLIALGLGPKHEIPTMPAKPQPDPGQH